MCIYICIYFSHIYQNLIENFNIEPDICTYVLSSYTSLITNDRMFIIVIYCCSFYFV